jgi:hypothetical protein
MFHQMCQYHTRDQLMKGFTLLEQQRELAISYEARCHYEAQLLFVQTFQPAEAANFDARFAT